MTTPHDKPSFSRVYVFLSSVLLLASAGCITMTNPFSIESQINRYLEKHPDRPQAIRQALPNQTLCKGMNPREVELCWGSPSSREDTEENGVKGQVWSYIEHHKGGTSSDHGSDLFDFTVPLGRAVFTTTSQGLALSEWTIYGEDDSGTKNSAKTAPADKPRVSKPQPETFDLRLPELSASPDLSRWPALRVTGTMKSGSKQVALINNILVGPGESIEGVKVVTVTETGVYLQYGAETIFLAKGKETRPPSESSSPLHDVFK